MDPETVSKLVENDASLKPARSLLEAMRSGAYCFHRSWGLGRIREYDGVENKLIVDFEEKKKGHRMDPAFCVNRLEILPPNHVLSRGHEEPEWAAEMIKKYPADLIVEILTHCPDNKATSAEFERILCLLMDPVAYKKWWVATRKILAKDPRVACPSKKAAPYILRDIPLLPEQEILEEYYLNKQPKKKILLAEKLHQISSSVGEIEKDLPQIFDELTAAIQEAHQLTQADRLHGVWVRNNLARHLHEDVELLEPTSASIILATRDLSKLARELPNQYHLRFLDLITRVYVEEWKDIIIHLLRNSSGKFTSECIHFLMERDCLQLVADHLKRWLNEQTLKASVLYWVLKNRKVQKFQEITKELVGSRLFSAILYAIDYEALHQTGKRRIALVDILVEDKTLVPDLLADANDETARDLAQTLLLNQGFEDLSKKSLLARFIRLFPSVQSLVAGTDEKGAGEEALLVSQESLDLRKKEYEELVQKKIPENKAAIAVAREHGDFRENAEYKMACQDQDTLLAYKAHLEKEFSRASVIDFSKVSVDVVGIGSTVALVKDSGEKKSCRILGAWDSDPENGVLSYKAPLGQALLGKRVGERIRMEIGDSVEEWKIKKISK